MMHSPIERPRGKTGRTQLRPRALTGEAKHYRQAYEKLKEANEKLLRSNEELTQFAYVASHDLQEPLRMVDSYLGLIEHRYKGKLDADADIFIGFAVDGARRMKRLIDDLLVYSRVNTRCFEIGEVDCNEAIADVLEVLADQAATAGAEIKIGTLPTIEADLGQIERLFANLIGNALKFRSENPPWINVSARRVGAAWEFMVTDNGIGIEPEFREKVFEIFARLHNRDQYEGSGIGLAACKRIVELHGGTIRADAAPGGGTAIRFTLPQHHEKEPLPC
jgi:light-regulated signal transduction histidine kinase (bacteriophytochrome)